MRQSISHRCDTSDKVHLSATDEAAQCDIQSLQQVLRDTGGVASQFEGDTTGRIASSVATWCIVSRNRHQLQFNNETNGAPTEEEHVRES